MASLSMWDPLLDAMEKASCFQKAGRYYMNLQQQCYLLIKSHSNDNIRLAPAALRRGGAALGAMPGVASKPSPHAAVGREGGSKGAGPS